MGTIILSFSGIDGSGKTTIAKNLAKILRKKFGICAVYKHEYEYTLLKLLLNLIGMYRRKKTLKSLEENVINGSKAKKIPLIVRLWPLIVLLDYLFYYVIVKLSKRKEVLILDRCIYDHWVSFKGQGIFSKIMEKLYLIVPRPDISFLLVVKPEVAYLRKKEDHIFTPDIYERGQKEYLKIAKLKNLKIIDSTKNVEITLKEVIKNLLTDKTFSKLMWKKSSQNRINWLVYNKYQRLIPYKFQSTLNVVFDERVKRLQQTLITLKDLFQKINVPWALFKTYYTILGDSYVPTYDIDIIIPREYKTKVLLGLNELSIKYSEDEPEKVNIRRYPYTVSIHFGACWEGFVYFEVDCNNLDKVVFHDIDVSVPSLEYQILTILAHILFEIKVLRLVDILEITALLENDKKNSYDKILEIADKYSWKEPAKNLLEKILQIGENLENIKKPLKMPQMISSGDLLKTYIYILNEKRRTGTLSFERVKVYIFEVIRWFIWYFGSKVIGRLPFGDVLTLKDKESLDTDIRVLRIWK